MEVCKSIIIENDELREQLLVKNKDLLQINKEKRSNINLEINQEGSPESKGLAENSSLQNQ